MGEAPERRGMPAVYWDMLIKNYLGINVHYI